MTYNKTGTVLACHINSSSQRAYDILDEEFMKEQCKEIRVVSMELGEGNDNPLRYSCLENPMDRGAWWAAVHGVAKSRTGLSDFTFTFQFHALEKEMATHSSMLAWRIPGTEEPSGLPSMGSHSRTRLKRLSSNKLSFVYFIYLSFN